jgi:hypothetical protein
LEQLLKNKELPDYLVYFFLDHGFNVDTLRVIKWFRKQHKNIKIKMQTEADSKKSPLPAFYNIFDAYRCAAEITDEYVIPGEEDIIPTEDYLRYNDEVYRRFLSKYDKIFCLGTKRRQINDLEGDPELLIGDTQLCQPTCVSKKVIQEVMFQYIDNDHFWVPPRFNQLVWPNARNKPDHHIHHDGQLERMAECNGMFCLKPDQARSGHIGVGGQHFKGKVEGNTLEEKVAYMKSMMHDTAKLKAASDNPYDMCGVPRTLEWNELQLDLDRDKVKTQKADFDPDNKFKEYILSCH